MQKPPTLRGGSTTLLGSVVKKRDAVPRERTNSEAESGTTAAAGANQKRSLHTLRMRSYAEGDHVQPFLVHHFLRLQGFWRSGHGDDCSTVHGF